MNDDITAIHRAYCPTVGCTWCGADSSIVGISDDVYEHIVATGHTGEYDIDTDVYGGKHDR